MSFKFGYEVTKAFFDKEDVVKRIDEKRRQMLLKAGAFVRKRAQRSLRRGKKAAKPGTPPKVHSTNDRVSLRNILFYSDGADGILIGPVGLNGSKPKGKRPVPGAQEKGDMIRVTEIREKIVEVPGKKRRRKKEPKWIVIDRNPKPSEESRQREVELFKRPFMGPALALEAPKFPSLFGEV